MSFPSSVASPPPPGHTCQGRKSCWTSFEEADSGHAGLGWDPRVCRVPRRHCCGFPRPSLNDRPLDQASANFSVTTCGLRPCHHHPRCPYSSSKAEGRQQTKQSSRQGVFHVALAPRTGRVRPTGPARQPPALCGPHSLRAPGCDVVSRVRPSLAPFLYLSLLQLCRGSARISPPPRLCPKSPPCIPNKLPSSCGAGRRWAPSGLAASQ